MNNLDDKRKHAARMKAIIPVCALCCAVLLGVGVWKSGLLRKNSGTNSTDKNPGQTTVTPGEPNNSQTTPTATPTVTVSPTATPTVVPPELEGSKDMTAGASDTPVTTKEMDDAMRTAYETFAYKLFAQIPEGETRMISPFSVYVALSMLADGADGETLAQLDELLGLTAEERNAYLAAWITDLTEVENGAATFSNADSIWIQDGLESRVPNDFLDICAQYYRAAVFSTPMDDSTVRDINAWVKANTRDMIEKLIDELKENTVMILMNAIAFDAKWEEMFDEAETQKDWQFTKADDTTVNVDMMRGEFEIKYFANNLVTGFVKPYKGGEFSYVALLPNNCASIKQMMESLQPGDIRTLCRNSWQGNVEIGIPKYEAEYSIELSDTLRALGVTDAFDDKADLSRLLELADTYVGQVNHKTYISVNEAGTSAAAVAEVEIMWLSGCFVILDRPFVYMIVDSDGLPIFMGTYEG